MPGHVAVAEQRQVVLELEVEALAPRLEQVRAVAAAERRADDALALLAADDRDAHEVGEVARARALRLRRPRSRAPRRSTGALTALTSSSVWPASTPSSTAIAERARVALGDAAEELDLDAVDRRALGERRRRAGRARGRAAGTARAPPGPRRATAGTLTAVVTLPPVSAATTCSAAWKPARSVASAVEAPRCGVTIDVRVAEQRVVGDRLGCGRRRAPRRRPCRESSAACRSSSTISGAARDVEDPHAVLASSRTPRRRASPRSPASSAGGS